MGIAIGSGTDVAIESSEVALMKDDLVDAVSALRLGSKMTPRIKQYILWLLRTTRPPFLLRQGHSNRLELRLDPSLQDLRWLSGSVTVVSLSLMLKGYVSPAKKRIERR